MALDPQEQLDNVQRKAAALYELVRKEHKSLNLPFAGAVSDNGSPHPVSPGDILLPSRTEMHDLSQLITLALSYWTQYNELPTVGQLHSSAESSEVDQVVFITMLYCMAMTGAFLARIGTGDLDTVSSILDHSTRAKVEPTTSPDTLSSPPRRLAGLSSPARGEDRVEEQSRSPRSSDGSRGTNSTSAGSSARKKKSSKSKGRRKKQRSTSK